MALQERYKGIYPKEFQKNETLTLSDLVPIVDTDPILKLSHDLGETLSFDADETAVQATIGSWFTYKLRDRRNDGPECATEDFSLYPGQKLFLLIGTGQPTDLHEVDFHVPDTVLETLFEYWVIIGKNLDHLTPE